MLKRLLVVLACAVGIYVGIMASAKSASLSTVNTCNERGCFSYTGAIVKIAKHKVTKKHLRTIKDDREGSRAYEAAKRKAKLQHRKSVTHIIPHRGGLDLVTVDTAANIAITVARPYAEKFKGFIADIVSRGYQPGKIHCYNLSASHVRNSLHFRGEACDFDQRGWGKTAKAMYHVADIAAKWGLRNGCVFADCGHIDTGNIRTARIVKPWPRVIEAQARP